MTPSASPPRTLNDWLAYAESVHPVGIDMGLERVGQVAGRMGLVHPPQAAAQRAVIVAGTNGKGSACMALETLLLAAGRRVGTTLSPHVHVFNERVRIDGALATDAMLCTAFEAVETARGETPLTYFEFSALVALDCFRRAGVEFMVLEVGLGGRLDAFNIVDAELAIITSIGVDHQAYLGNDPEVIGREKAGVLRPRQRVVLGSEVSGSVRAAAANLDCTVTRLGRDVHIRERAGCWDFDSPAQQLAGLPYGALAPYNCALALAAAEALVGPAAPGAGPALARTTLPGRFETWQLADGRLLILDVAHNPAGAQFLCAALQRRHPGRRFIAVLAMLADKDGAGVASAMDGVVHDWVCVPTHGDRALPAAVLAERITAAAPAAPIHTEADERQGLSRALSLCAPEDGILVFGSFGLAGRMRDVLLAGFADAVAAPGPALDSFMDRCS